MEQSVAVSSTGTCFGSVQRGCLAERQSHYTTWVEISAIHNLGRRQWEEAIVLFRQIGDWRFLAQTLGILGSTVLSNGDPESAEKFLDEAYEVNQQINNI